MSVFRLKQGFIIQKQGNKTIIFDPEKSILHSFNDTASFMFDQLKKNLTDEQIINMIIKKYAISKKEATEDFTEFITQLIKKKIITQI
jgi:hypothetical protein